MTTESYREAETVTRSVARWGSVAAAVIFGVAFVTDRTLSWHIVTGEIVQIAWVSAIFVGYALALTQRFEVVGSMLALLAVAGFCSISLQTVGLLPTLSFLAVGLPAVFHLAAVAFHRYAVPRQKANP